MTGEEFEVFIELLGKLQHLSSPDGSQQIILIIAEQAELSEDFQVGVYAKWACLHNANIG